MSIESRELRLFIDNNYNIYHQYLLPYLKSLSKKFKKGVYSKSKAIIGYKLIANIGAKMYAKEFAKPSEWNVIFSVNDRLLTAKELEKEYYDEIKDGDYL